MDYVDVHDFCSVSALVIGAHGKASGCCSQSERLLFGRDTRNLRRSFRRFVGRNRKSRRREAAGRRNYPEAVPNGEGGNGNNAPTTCPTLSERGPEPSGMQGGECSPKPRSGKISGVPMGSQMCCRLRSCECPEGIDSSEGSCK